MSPKVGTSTVASELEELARFFHQDFGVLFASVGEGATTHFRSLSSKRRLALRSELLALLAEHPGKSERGLLNAWHRLGAEHWRRGSSLRTELASWVTELEALQA